MMEEAKAREHRKLGKELELFALMEEGRGLPFYFPKGLILRGNKIRVEVDDRDEKAKM